MREHDCELLIKYISSVVVLVAFCLVLRGNFHLSNDTVYIMQDAESRALMPSSTSDNFKMTKEFYNTLSDFRYTRFSQMLKPSLSNAIPGLSQADVLGENCETMVPQGICFAKNYMLISAYDYGKKVDGRYSKCNSVIYVLSNENPKERKYLTTIVLPDINHVGGLAFDGRYVWIAKSTSGTCSALDMYQIELAVISGQNSYAVKDYIATVDCGMTASFLSYYDNMLWIGTFANQSKKNGTLSSFEIQGSGSNLRLEKKNTLAIPCYANGVTLERINGVTCMAVVCSFSRSMDSKVYIYRLNETKDGAMYVKHTATYRFPPMGEEVASDGQYAYFLFESAANVYSENLNKCLTPVDRVCAVAINDLFMYMVSETQICDVSGGSPLKCPIVTDMMLPKNFYEWLEKSIA